MNIIHDHGQDRLILELFVWVSIDPKTNLEGICGLKIGPLHVQAVCSSEETAMRMKNAILDLCHSVGKRAKLLRFKNPEIVSL